MAGKSTELKMGESPENMINSSNVGKKQCHKPPMWEWFLAPIYGDIGGWFIIVLPILQI
jgi:hypothetical protein